MDNLPVWQGASECYTRMARATAIMAQSGHVTKTRRRCYLSPDLIIAIDLMNKGEEEPIKAWLLYTAPRLLGARYRDLFAA